MGNNKTTKKNLLTRKTAQTEIIKVLETSLGDLQLALGNKKFKQRIKKASKLLSNGLPKSKKTKSQKLKKIILLTADNNGINPSTHFVQEFPVE